MQTASRIAHRLPITTTSSVFHRQHLRPVTRRRPRHHHLVNLYPSRAIQDRTCLIQVPLACHHAPRTEVNVRTLPTQAPVDHPPQPWPRLPPKLTFMTMASRLTTIRTIIAIPPLFKVSQEFNALLHKAVLIRLHSNTKIQANAIPVTEGSSCAIARPRRYRD